MGSLLLAIRVLSVVAGILVMIVILRRGNLRPRWRKLGRWHKAMWIFGMMAALSYSLMITAVFVVPESGTIGALLYAMYACIGCALVCSVIGSAVNTLRGDTGVPKD